MARGGGKKPHRGEAFPYQGRGRIRRCGKGAGGGPGLRGSGGTGTPPQRQYRTDLTDGGLRGPPLPEPPWRRLQRSVFCDRGASGRRAAPGPTGSGRVATLLSSGLAGPGCATSPARRRRFCRRGRRGHRGHQGPCLRPTGVPVPRTCSCPPTGPPKGRQITANTPAQGKGRGGRPPRPILIQPESVQRASFHRPGTTSAASASFSASPRRKLSIPCCSTQAPPLSARNSADMPARPKA